MTERVLVIGASTVDIKGLASGPLISSTSNPGQIKFSCGGEARNVADNLARLGLDAKLFSAVGRDGLGHTVLEETAQAGVDMEAMIISPDRHTAAYLAVLDESGALAVSIDDMMVLDLITPQYIFRHRKWFKQAVLVVMDANVGPATMGLVFKLAERYRVPVALNTVSVSLAPRVRPFLSRLHVLAANLSEASAVVGRPLADHTEAMAAAREMVSAGVKIAIITLAENGLCYATPSESGYISAISCDVVDNTGAGAALMAAVLYGLIHQMPAAEAMRLGVSAATLTLKCAETVCKELDLEHLYDQLVI